MIKGCISAKLELSLLSCLLYSHHVTAVAPNSPAEVTAPRPALRSGRSSQRPLALGRGCCLGSL